MNEVYRKLAEMNGTLEKEYGATVNRLVRERYNLPEELAILRQRDEKPEEFAAYNAFVEECKAKAKAEIYGEEKTE